MANNAAITASGVIGLTWQAPSSNGGSAVIDYQISYKTGTAAYTTLASGINALSYTASSLQAGITYTFKVRAKNAVNFGPDSSEVSILAAKVPTQPLSLANNAAITAAGTIGITWSVPSSNGGSAIIDYQISYKTGTAAYTTLASAITATSYTASSLTVGATYTFKVTARNAVNGFSPDSNEVSIIAASKPT